MAAIKFETLVLRGIRVVGDVVANSVRLVSGAAHGKPPANLSYPRHLPQGFLGQNPPRLNRIEIDLDEDCARERTGRSGSHAGNLVSTPPASLAGRAVLCGWPIAEGGDLPTDITSVSPMAPRTPPTTIMPTLAHARLTAWQKANARRDQRLGTPSVSTRGISDERLLKRQGSV